MNGGADNQNAQVGEKVNSSVSDVSQVVMNGENCARVIWHSDEFANSQVTVTDYAIGLIYLKEIVMQTAVNPGEPQNINGYQLLPFEIVPPVGGQTFSLYGAKGDIYQFDPSCSATDRLDWIAEKTAGTALTSLSALQHYGFIK